MAIDLWRYPHSPMQSMLPPVQCSLYYLYWYIIDSNTTRNFLEMYENQIIWIKKLKITINRAKMFKSFFIMFIFVVTNAANWHSNRILIFRIWTLPLTPLSFLLYDYISFNTKKQCIVYWIGCGQTIKRIVTIKWNTWTIVPVNKIKMTKAFHNSAHIVRWSGQISKASIVIR